MNLGAVLLAVEVDGERLLGEDDGHVAEVAGHAACDADAGGLDGEDLVDGLACEVLGPGGAHVVEELHVALVVEEGVNLQHVAGLYRTVAPDALLEFDHAHRCRPSF